MIKKRINLIVTGSSQASNALELYKLLTEEFDVNVILSQRAHHFVQFPDDIPVHDKIWTTDFYEFGDENEHLAFATNVAFNVVYPATADFIGKATSGLANDMATAVFAIQNGHIPTLIFPGYHTRLERNPFLKRNLKIMQEVNPLIHIFDTFYGVFPDGETGNGRVYDPKSAASEISRFANRKIR